MEKFDENNDKRKNQNSIVGKGFKVLIREEQNKKKFVLSLESQKQLVKDVEECLNVIKQKYDKSKRNVVLKLLKEMKENLYGLSFCENFDFDLVMDILLRMIETFIYYDEGAVSALYPVIYQCVGFTYQVEKRLMNKVFGEPNMQLYQQFQKGLRDNNEQILFKSMIFYQKIINKIYSLKKTKKQQEDKNHDDDLEQKLFSICKNVSERHFKESSHRAIFIIFIFKIWFLHTSKKEFKKEEANLEKEFDLMTRVLLKNTPALLAIIENLLTYLISLYTSKKASKSFQIEHPKRALDNALVAFILTSLFLSFNEKPYSKTIFNYLIQSRSLWEFIKNNHFEMEEILNGLYLNFEAHNLFFTSQESYNIAPVKFRELVSRLITNHLINLIIKNCLERYFSTVREFQRLLEGFEDPQQKASSQFLKTFRSFISELKSGLSLYFVLNKDKLRRKPSISPPEDQKDDTHNELLSIIRDNYIDLTSDWSFFLFSYQCELGIDTNHFLTIVFRERKQRLNPKWLCDCQYFGYFNTHLVVFLQQFSRDLVKHLDLNNTKNSNNFEEFIKKIYILSEYVIKIKSENLSAEMITILINCVWSVLNLPKAVQEGLQASSWLLFHFLQNLLFNHLSKYQILKINNTHATKIIKVLVSYFSKNEITSPETIIDLVTILMCFCVRSERRFMILLFEIFEKILSITNAQSKKWSFFPENETGEHMEEEIFTDLGKNLLDEVDLPVPMALKQKKKKDSLDEKNKPNWNYFLLLLKLFLKKDIKEKRKIMEYDCDEYVLNRINECKTAIFQTTASEYQSYCITSKRILEFFLTDMGYEKGNWNNLIKNFLPRYSTNPFDVFIRKKIIENKFLLLLMKNIFFYTESQFLQDTLLSIMGNLVSMFADPELKEKPYFTLDVIMKILTKKEIIHQKFKVYREVFPLLQPKISKDIIMLILNLIIQFKTYQMIGKRAADIKANQVLNYATNLKAILMEDLDKITDYYPEVIQVFD